MPLGSPGAVVITPDGAYAYVANGNAVSVISIGALNVNVSPPAWTMNVRTVFAVYCQSYRRYRRLHRL